MIDLDSADSALILNTLLESLAEALGRDVVEPAALDPDERFYALGLDSARAASWLAKLGERLGRSLPLTAAWQYPTPRDLASAIVAADRTGFDPRGLGAPPATCSGAQGRTLIAVENEPIAVVGLACRLPGAEDPRQLWTRLVGDRETVGEVPADRWPVDRFYDPDPLAAGKMNTRRGGFLDRIDRFDAEFFAISPAEARHMDPQQRLLLELAWEALEDAAISPSSWRGRSVGVFVGAMGCDYRGRISRDSIGPHTATGTDTSVLAGRLSYTFGFTGPSWTVNTACSSSLVAIHQACAALRRGEAEAALAAGVHLMVGPDGTIAMSKFGGLAPDGRSKAFDAEANGYARGEGGGMVVLKRGSRALADGDAIYAWIRGGAVNSDGFSNGLTAPNPEAQRAMLRRAYAQAGVDPGSVAYVETHGPGTFLGDPIEAAALGAVLGAARPSDRPLRIGSHKPLFGHLEAAAGVTGLIKTCLALRHRRLLPSLGFRRPNPNIDFAGLGLRVQTEPEPWPGDEQPLAGVSAFGFSGTNCHLVLQGLPAVRGLPAAGPVPATPAAQPVFVYGGNGSQWSGMARELLREPVFHQAMERCDAVTRRLQPAIELMADLSAPPDTLPDTASIQSPFNQVALVALQWSWTRLLATWGVRPAAVVGHSLGEVTAACVAGALSLRQALEVAHLRAWAQADRAGDGGLVLLELDVDAARLLIDRLDLGDSAQVSAINGPRSVAVSGSTEAIDALSRACIERRVVCRAVPVDLAFHSRQMEAPAARLRKRLDQLQARPPELPMISTVDGQPVADRLLNADHWAEHLHRPVLFDAAIRALWRLGRRDFVEIGPHPVVRRPLEQILEALRGDPPGEPGRTFTLMDRSRPLRGPDAPLSKALDRWRRQGLAVPDSAFDDPGPAPCESIEPWGTPDPTDHGPWWIPFSARHPEALAAMMRRAGDLLAERPEVTVESLAWARARADSLPLRKAWIAHGRRSLIAGLRAQPAESATRPRRCGEVWVFSGQGGQWTGMGRRLGSRFPVFRDALEACDRAVASHLSPAAEGSLVDRLLAETPPDSSEPAIDVMQPMIFALQVALAETLRSFGVAPSAVIGHSMGEVAAAHVAGILDLDQAARVICARSRRLNQLRGRGTLWATELTPAAARELIQRRAPHGRVGVAAVNGPRSTVLSGPRPDLQALASELDALQVFHRQIRVDVPSHSPLVDAVLADLNADLNGLCPSAGGVPLWSTVSGELIDGEAMDADYWCREMRRPVAFGPAIQGAARQGATGFVEIGPHPVLVPAIEDGLRSAKPSARAMAWAVGTLKRDEDPVTCLFQTLAQLYEGGAEIDARGFAGPAQRPVRLPTYPWQRRRYWIDPLPNEVPGPARAAGPHPWLELPVESSLHPGELLFSGAVGGRDARARGHGVCADAAFPDAETPRDALSVGDLWSLSRAAVNHRGGHQDAQGGPREASAGVWEGLRLHDIMELSNHDDDPLHLQVGIDSSGKAPARPWRVQVSGRAAPASEPWHRALTVGWTPGAPAPEAERIAAPREGDGGRFGIGRLASLLARRGIHQSPNRLGQGELRWSVDRSSAARVVWARRRWPGSDATALPARALDGLFELLIAGLFREDEGDAWAASGVDRLWWSGDPLPESAELEGGVLPRDGRSAGIHPRVGDGSWWHGDQPVMIAEGLRLKRVARAHQRRLDEAIYETIWTTAPELREAAADPSEPAVWWLLAAPGDWVDTLTTALEAGGHEVEHRPFGSFSGSELGGRRGRSRVRVVILPATQGGSGPGDDPLGKPAEDEIWGPCLRILSRLARGVDGGSMDAAVDVRVCCVTRGLSAADAPLGGSLLDGLMATAGEEIPHLRPAWIDLVGEPNCRALIQECLNGDQARVVLRGSSRSVMGLRRVVMPARTDSRDAPQGTWLITGGTGDLGLAVASELASRGVSHLLLAARSAPSGEVQSRIEELRRQGVQVLLDSVDVGSPGALAEMLDRRFGQELRGAGTDRLPPLDGVAHLAAVATDRPLRELTAEQVRVSLHAKAGGAWHLHRACDAYGPRHLILFSSSAARVGVPGQGAYAMANGFLDALARRRRRKGKPALSVAWPGWSSRGMAKQAGARRGLDFLARRGMESLTESQGRALFSALIDRPPAASDLLVLPLHWPSLMEFPNTGAPLPYLLRSLGAGDSSPSSEGPIFSKSPACAGDPASGEDHGSAELRHELLALPPARRRRALEQALRRQLAAVLGMESDVDLERRLAADRPWAELGLGSLMAAELRGRLERLTGLSLSILLVWRKSCLAELAEHLAVAMGVPLSSTSSAPGEQSPPDPESDDALLTSLLDALPDLDGDGF